MEKNKEYFWEWFDKKRGDLTIRQVEERAEVPRGRIGNAYGPKRKPTPLICQAIAKGLNISLEEVLREASILVEETDQDSSFYHLSLPSQDPSSGSAGFLFNALKASMETMPLSQIREFRKDLLMLPLNEFPIKNTPPSSAEVIKCVNLFLQLNKAKQISALDYIQWLVDQQRQEEEGENKNIKK